MQQPSTFSEKLQGQVYDICIHVHPGSNFDNSRGVFGTSLSSYILEKAASRKLDKGPSLESSKWKKTSSSTSSNKTSEFSGFSKVTTYSPLNLLVQETMEQQKVPQHCSERDDRIPLGKAAPLSKAPWD